MRVIDESVFLHFTFFQIFRDLTLIDLERQQSFPVKFLSI